MHALQLAERNNAIASETTCPYRPAKSFFCSAAVMAVAIDSRRRSTYCNTEDFDRCPLFLAKVLRGA